MRAGKMKYNDCVTYKMKVTLTFHTTHLANTSFTVFYKILSTKTNPLTINAVV